MQPQAPAQTPAMPEMQKPKVTLNPFKHLINGAKNMFATNVVGALLTMVLASVFYFVIMLGFGFLLAKIITDFQAGSPFPLGRFIVGAVAFLAILIVAASIVNQVVMRTVVTGSRKQKVTIGEAFKLVLERIGLTILTFLLVCGVFLGTEIVVLLPLLLKLPLVTVLLAIIASGAFIVSVFHLAYIGFVLVDDDKPTGPVAVIRQSSRLWKRSRGALLLYLLICFFISLAASVITGDNRAYTTTSTTYSTKTTTYTAPQTYDSSEDNTLDTTITPAPIGMPNPNVRTTETATMTISSMLLTSVVSGLFSIVIFSGLGKIYNDAKVLEGLPAQQLAGGSPPKSPEQPSAVPAVEPQVQATPSAMTPPAPEPTPNPIEQPPESQPKDQ